MSVLKFRGAWQRKHWSNFCLITQNFSINITRFSVTATVTLVIPFKLLSSLFHSSILSAKIVFKPVRRACNFFLVCFISFGWPQARIFTFSMSHSCCLITLLYRRLVRMGVRQRGQDLSLIAPLSSSSMYLQKRVWYRMYHFLNLSPFPGKMKTFWVHLRLFVSGIYICGTKYFVDSVWIVFQVYLTP